MRGKRILVTGAASGIGKATTRLLVDRGAAVVAVDRDRDALRALDKTEPLITCRIADLADSDLIEDVVADLDLDGVANVAGVGPDAQDAARIFAVNLVAPLRILQAVHSRMSPGSAVVNVASIAGSLMPDDDDPVHDDPLADGLAEHLACTISDPARAYAYSKWALVRETRRLALEWAPEVRVNSVSPGLVDTPMGMRTAEFPWVQKLSSRTPLARHANACEVASAIVFLLSDGASYISGIDLRVDGGYGATRLSSRSVRP